MKAPLGLVLYRGPSALTGHDIVIIVTGFRGTDNQKTGNMLQTWILPVKRSPVQAIQTGYDEAVCGSCPLRGIVKRISTRRANRQRGCYVNVLKMGPHQVWESYKRGAYVEYEPRKHNKLLRGKLIRFGSYGDPAAAPVAIWRKLARLSGGWTGYTHQWREFPQFASLLMASCETEQGAAAAIAAGWRVFRSRLPDAPLMQGEIVCPASAEGGERRTCSTCMACNGRKGADDGRVSISIIAHGSPATLSSYKKTAVGSEFGAADSVGKLPSLVTTH